MGYTHYFKFKDGPAQERILHRMSPEVAMIAEASDVALKIDYDVDSETGMCNSFKMNGIDDDGHEQLSFQWETRGFVKTNRKAYDLTVCVILLRIKQLAGDAFELSSDGRWNNEWVAARKLYHSLWAESGCELLCPWNETQSTAVDLPTVISCEKRSQNSEPSHANRFDERDGYNAGSIFMPYADHLQLCLSRCLHDQLGHKDCVQESLDWVEIPGVTFRLIDVFRGCVVEHMQPPDYVVLSYVWGQTRQQCLTKATRQHLLEKGSLSRSENKPAATIVDAMSICKILGKQYLWVDSLCIMQDDSRDMSIQILRMRQVFACAALTIVSASTEHASDRLIIETGQNGTGSASGSDIFSGSPWQKRAWTYQEGALSHRQLIFSHSGIYFSCRHNITQLRETCDDDEIYSPMQIQPTFLTMARTPGTQLQAWQEAVTAYSERELTYETDLINAFQGIMKSFGSHIDGLPNRFHHGLPTSSFDQAICWSTDYHSPQSRRSEYPSWSWLGWKQKITWPSGEWITHPEQRSSQILWPQWSDGYWNLFAKVYKTTSKPEIARRAFEDGDPFGAHQWLTRKPCRYWGDPIDIERAWGLPAAYIGYAQERQLRIMGSVARLRVTEADDVKNRGDKVQQNKTFRVFSTTTPCREFGVINLDPIWRSTQPELMDFLLVDGFNDERGELVGTRLMCLARLTDDDDAILKCERVGVMDVAPITEDVWKEAGGVTRFLIMC